MRRQEGEEEEVTREVGTHCHESLVTLEGKSAGQTNTGNK